MYVVIFIVLKYVGSNNKHILSF